MLTLPLYRTEINPHVAYSDDQLHEIFEVARTKSPEVYALISLLHTGALRIQDAIGLTFGSVTNLRADKGGCVKLHITAKKSTARFVTLDQKTVNAVKAYQDSIGASDSTEMFPAGSGTNPANKWT